MIQLFRNCAKLKMDEILVYLCFVVKRESVIYLKVIMDQQQALILTRQQDLLTSLTCF